jgi:pyrimidine-nucleoside phosphorylase
MVSISAVPTGGKKGTHNFTEILQRKRDGGSLSKDAIQFFVNGVTQGTIPDYQISALLMAIYLQGMSIEETTALTLAMRDSGKVLQLKKLKKPKVDKHSTGGVGDKVTIILAPLAAACGLIVPSMAGRGLGHTGGTIDKLEAIPGYRVVLGEEEFISVLERVGCAIIGQSAEVAPCDRKLYALRDVTATIDCIPLITSSILSKKMAEGTDGLVLDIKVGNGAFMKTKREATALAKTLKSVGSKAGLKIKITLSNMDQPLGYAAGNAIEIYECIEVLRNETLNPFGLKSPDLRQLTIHLCAQMLEVGGIVRSLSEGRKLAQQKLHDGSALKVFREMIVAQGGRGDIVSDPSSLFRAERVIEIAADRSGFLSFIDTYEIGRILIAMGAGRKTIVDSIDLQAGLLMHKKLGMNVKKGEALVTVFCRNTIDTQAIISRLRGTLKITSTKPRTKPLMLETALR